MNVSIDEHDPAARKHRRWDEMVYVGQKVSLHSLADLRSPEFFMPSRVDLLITVIFLR
jgi:hypothetical protein